MSSEKIGTAEFRLWLIGGFLAVALMLSLRVVALDSDAYPRLSWSSALLTDEGFYIHNARNTVLFGHPQTDQFNNALIMPLLDALQTTVFRRFGVGAIQARSVSVVLGLLTLPVFFDALRRAFGRRTAVWGTLFLGLDHVSLLYSRLALMDTPAAFLLVCGWWAWVKSGEAGRQRGVWLFVCGLVLGLCYSVRGLGALVYLAPAGLLAWEGWRGRGEPKEYQEEPGTERGERRGMGRFVPLVCLLVGLGVSLGGYVLVWYLPHRAELTRVNHYYLFDQLIPHNVTVVRQNLTHNLFGDERGFSPYLFRHTPVQFVLVLLGLSAAIVRREWLSLKGSVRANAGYAVGWLLVMWMAFGVAGYSPSRYYVLFYPALAVIAALTLTYLDKSFQAVWRSRAARLLIGGFLVYHLLETFLHHRSSASDFGLYGLTLLGMVGLWFWQPVSAPCFGERERRWAGLTVLLWAGVNAGWTGDWLAHLDYSQRDADRWLAANLPAQSVLIGDTACGLSMNSRFVAVPVLPGLCNDVRPLESFAPAQRYLVLMEGQRSLAWWRSRYPAVIMPENRKRRFPHLVAFAVTVYAVPAGAETALPSVRPESR